MKRWFFGAKKHIDEEKKAQEAQDLRNIRWLMDHGSDEMIMQYLRGLKPDATTSELQTLMVEFHRQRAERMAQQRLGS
jgi:hypothetical protein